VAEPLSGTEDRGDGFDAADRSSSRRTHSVDRRDEVTSTEALRTDTSTEGIAHGECGLPEGHG